MACQSIVALPRNCGTEGVAAGLEKAYIISYADLAPISGSTEVFGVATNGIVNAVGLQTGKKFAEIGLLKSTAGMKEVLTKNLSMGTAYLTQTFTLVLGNLTVENKAFVESVLNQPVAIVLKARSGNYYFAGGNGLLELATAEGGTGITESELIGYSMTFSGIDTKLMPQIDSSIVASLIA